MAIYDVTYRDSDGFLEGLQVEIPDSIEIQFVFVEIINKILSHIGVGGDVSEIVDIACVGLRESA